ncbi:MAG: flagellar basal body-associated protein FliL [Methylocystis sp.]|jgi:hypothetical protein
MLRTLLIGLWVGAVALASTYGGAYWKLNMAPARTNVVQSEKVEVRKVKPLTAPVISGGELKGYVSAEFAFSLDPSKPLVGGLDPEAYFMDEAFRIIYSDNEIDFQHVKKIDVDALTKRITARVNERIGSDAVKETLVKNLVFVSKDEMPR